MKLRSIGLRVRGSLVAALSGWAIAVAATLPMQVYQIAANNLNGVRSLLWSLAAGMAIWCCWTLWFAALGWLFVCLPALAVLRERWLLRHRRAAVVGSAIFAWAAVMTMTQTWRLFEPDYTFHPWVFFLYMLHLVVFAAATAAVYLRILQRIRHGA